MENKIDYQILKKGAACFKQARVNLIQGAAILFKIEKDELWRGQFSSFSEYVEDECQIGKSFAAKLVKIFQYYVAEHQLDQKELEGIDTEKLYLSINLSGTPMDQLLRASTWTRGEIKQELAVKDGEECQHPNPIHICGTCKIRL